MTLTKAFCCLSLRLGSLIFLQLFTFYISWVLFDRISTLVNSKSKDLWDDKTYIITTLGFAIEIFIFSATIISISNRTPAISLLWTAIVIFLWKIILLFNLTIQSVYLLIRKDVRIELYSKASAGVVYIGIILLLSAMLYAVFIFYSYIVELKKLPLRRVQNREKFNAVVETETDFPSPPAYNLQNTEREYPQNPPYPSRVSSLLSQTK